MDDSDAKLLINKKMLKCVKDQMIFLKRGFKVNNFQFNEEMTTVAINTLKSAYIQGGEDIHSMLFSNQKGK